MAQVEGLNLRGSRWYVRIVIPGDLRAAFGKDRVNIALGASDRREATLLATMKRAEWLADFEAKRAEQNPAPLPSISPRLASHLAALVRVHVLSEDDRVRADVALLAEMVHVRREIALRKLNPLRIPQWEPTEPREDDLSGLTPEEAAELADLNAYMDGNAAIAMAGGNLKAVLPLVQSHAAKLGLHFDAKTPGAREALTMRLKAYRAAHRELTQRHAGEVIKTPPLPAPRRWLQTLGRLKTSPRPCAMSSTTGNALAQRRAAPRKDDSIKAMDRTLRQFEAQHPKVVLMDITREMGDAY